VSAQSATDNEDAGSNNTLAIAALVLSCIAIAAVLAIQFSASNNKAAAKSEALPLTRDKTDEPSVSVPPSVN